MMPRTISASALKVADLCLARYYAENIQFTPSEANKVAANIGTACHGALEKYVEAVYMKKAMEPSLELLLSFYLVSYLETFDTVESKTPEYKDGEAMLKTWFKRTDFTGITVISVEKKTRFPIPTSAGDIPLTYIWDRCDTWMEGDKKVVRIVDYKTIRANVSPDELREMLQARIYDLMARVQFKDADVDEYQVVFDLLRHEPVGVIFSAEEAAGTWRAIIARAERIIATPVERIPETLNPECAYCVRKVSCKTLQRNIAGGGVFSIGSVTEAVEMRFNMANQVKGIESTLEQLDAYILAYAQQVEQLAWKDDVAGLKVSISATKRRIVDSKTAADVLGPELMKEFATLRVGDVDTLIKEERITPEQAAKINKSMSFSLSSPSIRITKLK